MYIYVGKLNWFEYAENECITIVFPAGFALKDPVCAYWQWTVTGSGERNANNPQEAFIDSVTNTSSDYRVQFSFGYYAFEGSVSADFKSASLKMSNPQGETSPVTLSLQHSDAVRVPSTSVFIGKLDWFQYSKNEMVILIIPGEVVAGEPVIMSRQWTEDSEGNMKPNHAVVCTITFAYPQSGGIVSATFRDGDYRYDFNLRRAISDLELYMYNEVDKPDVKATFHLHQRDFRDLRKKKALIVRFGTGRDSGIFKVQEMLVRHLGFASADVELSYFNIDSPGKPKQCTFGQDPPTVTNFKLKFTELCKSAIAGEVRFLYVDAHGTNRINEDHSGEPDDQSKGWVLADNDDGTRTEVLHKDWLGEVIRENLTKGVNLTILTSSYMGDGALDPETSTPGILLAGCHEIQVNAKALNGMDPWIAGITSVIKNNIRRKRGVPTYSVLYNEAKQFIRAQLAGGKLSPEYKGPSPQEWQPIPRDQDTNASHQDPQLAFYQGYTDPNEERFLFPFQALSGDIRGGGTRYPNDEYPRDVL